jgi:hypothetical protein
MKRTGFLIVVVIVFMLALTLGACGGSATDSASGGPSPSDSPGAPLGPRDTSTPAKALLGHWKDANGADQYFDGSEWSTVTSGGEKWSYKYEVKSEDAGTKQVLLKTYRLESDGTTPTDVQDIRFTFLNKKDTQMQWGIGGLSADFVDMQRRP